jgi:nitrogen fixation protein NifU and related proteins
LNRQPHEGLVMSDAFLEHALTPQNLGMLPPPAHSAQARGTCGDSIDMYLRVEDDVIVGVRFMPHGCLHTTACGSALTSLALGSDLVRAAELDAQQVEAALGGLPREHRHCAALAVSALRAALRAHYQERQSPWKKLYQPAGQPA